MSFERGGDGSRSGVPQADDSIVGGGRHHASIRGISDRQRYDPGPQPDQEFLRSDVPQVDGFVVGCGREDVAVG